MNGLTMVANYALRMFTPDTISISNSFISLNDLNTTKSYIRITSNKTLTVD